MTSPVCATEEFEVKSEDVGFDDDFITADYVYRSTRVSRKDHVMKVEPVTTRYTFRTQRTVPRTGVMVVGLGGNNGTTVTGGILANKHHLTWETKRGVMEPNYFGSITQSTVTFLGNDEHNQQVFVPMKSLLPTASPNDFVIGGWDINGAPLDVAMARASVFHANLQRKLAPLMSEMRPLPSIYYPDFIAANQADRADNVIKGSKACLEHLEHLRTDIRKFKQDNELDKVVVIWSANTERFSDMLPGIHDTEENILRAIKEQHEEIAPSQMFAIASILEGCAYINGSPQNTFAPGILEMAAKRGVFIGGDDFKSGQTKIKSVLADFLVSSGIKPESIVSYNHLGNNDGKNLSAPRQFRSKEISKSNVVDDVVASNGLLYKDGEKPDHCVVIKYVPHVMDSKRAMDEYISTIFMNGDNTIVLHNTCEDSLLAAPLIIDLIVLTELFQRVEYKIEGEPDFHSFRAVLTMLSFLLKAPLVPDDAPLVNAFFKQRACIENVLRACIGLPPITDMHLEHKTAFGKQMA